MGQKRLMQNNEPDGSLVIRKFCVGLDQTLFDCMKAIDSGGQGIAFVLDENQSLVGCMTDGDIRREIIQNQSLESRTISKTMNSNFVSVGVQATRNEILDLMRLNGVHVIPVVDQDGRLAGIHQWTELAGRDKKENWAVIMAGGKGSRLGSITARTPKPMLTIGGKPILERLVIHLASYGISRIFISVNHLSEVIEEYFEDGAKFGCDIEYLRETKPLNTGGALSLLPETPKHDLIVMNGDLVTQIDVTQFIQFQKTKNCDLTMAIRTHSTEVPYGVVDIKEGLIQGVSEKPRISQLINCGMYVVSPKALELMPDNENTPITWLVEKCLQKQWKVGGYLAEGEWIDIGDPGQLRKARKDD